MALNIPVLPVAINSVPGEIVSQLQAIVVKNDFSDFADWKQACNRKLGQDLITCGDCILGARIDLQADWQELLTELLAQEDISLTV